MPNTRWMFLGNDHIIGIFYCCWCCAFLPAAQTGWGFLNQFRSMYGQYGTKQKNPQENESVCRHVFSWTLHKTLASTEMTSLPMPVHFCYVPVFFTAVFLFNFRIRLREYDTLPKRKKPLTLYVVLHRDQLHSRRQGSCPCLNRSSALTWTRPQFSRKPLHRWDTICGNYLRLR